MLIKLTATTARSSPDLLLERTGPGLIPPDITEGVNDS
jgi:hypothetical protein